MKSVKIPNSGSSRLTLVQQGLSQIESSRPEVWHGSNPDADEGSDDGIGDPMVKFKVMVKRKVAKAQIILVSIWIVLPPVGEEPECAR